jgi:cbb3-type cytochrome oxidase maturation protein
MLSSILMLIILSLFLATGAWLIFLWAVRKGEFDDPEAPKYRMLDDDEALPANLEDRHDPPA